MRFDRNDYSVPTAYAHHEVTVIGGIEEVRHHLRDRGRRPPPRVTGAKSAPPSTRSTTWPSWRESPAPSTSPGRSRTGSCPDASPRCAGASKPTSGTQGTREFIKVLRLLENATLPALTKAVESAITIGATGSDAIALILFHHAEQPVGLFSLDGHPHLKAVAIDPPDLTAYRALTGSAHERFPGHIRAPSPAHFHRLSGHHIWRHAPDERSNTMKATKPSPRCSCTTTSRPSGCRRWRPSARRWPPRPPPTTPTTSPTCCGSPSWSCSNGRSVRPSAGSKSARFPTIKTLETFDFAARPSVNKVLIAELMRCEYIDKKENILMVGNPGTGKSHLATALAAQACAKGYRVRFIRTTELVTALIEARDERSFLRLKGQFAKLDLLVLDELGYVPASKVGSELLFDVISTAYERTSLIVTTNLPFESWTEVLGSERLTGATLDRLTHRCRIIETKGESYRLQDAKARTSRRRQISHRNCGRNHDPQANFTQPKCCRFRPFRAAVLDRDSHCP